MRISLWRAAGRSLAIGVVVAIPARAQTTSSAVCAHHATPIGGSSPAIAPIDVANSHVYVTVCAGDRPLEFIFDTGAGASFFDLNTAQRAGLSLGSPFTARGAGAGTIRGAQLQDGSVTLAGTDVQQRVGAAIDLSELPAHEGHRMDGILGYDFIARYVVAIDYVKHELRLYDRDRFEYTGPGTSLPITFYGNHPHVDAEVLLNDGSTIKGRMVVDVGAATALSLSKPLVESNHLRDRVGPVLRRRAAGGVGGSMTADIGRVAALRLGNLQLDRPITYLYGDSAGVFSQAGPSVGNIGGDILRRFTVYLDYKNKRIILEPNAVMHEPFESDMSGIALMLDDSLKTVTVDNVVPNTPAAAAGLMAGDTVVSVDGHALGMHELPELKARLRREGEHVVFTIRRGGATKTIAFVTRRLV